MKISRVRAMEILKSTIQEVFPLYNLAKLRGKKRQRASRAQTEKRQIQKNNSLW